MSKRLTKVMRSEIIGLKSRKASYSSKKVGRKLGQDLTYQQIKEKKDNRVVSHLIKYPPELVRRVCRFYLSYSLLGYFSKDEIVSIIEKKLGVDRWIIKILLRSRQRYY